MLQESYDGFVFFFFFKIFLKTKSFTLDTMHYWSTFYHFMVGNWINYYKSGTFWLFHSYQIHKSTVSQQLLRSPFRIRRLWLWKFDTPMKCNNFLFSNKVLVLCVKPTREIYFIRDHWEPHCDAITTFNHTIVFAEDRKSFASTNQNKNLY